MSSAGESGAPSAMNVASSSTAGDGNNSGSIGNQDFNRNSSSNNNSSNSSNMNSTMALPTGFLEDPAGFLTSIASLNRQGIWELSMLEGPLAKWFQQAERARFESLNECNKTNNATTMDDSSATAFAVQTATTVAHLYLRAAAVSLRGSYSGGMSQEMVAMAIVPGFDPQQQQQQQQQQNTALLEGVGAAAALCSDPSAIASSGILPLLAQIVEAASWSSSSSSSFGIAAPLSNISSSKSFPPLTQAHVAFVQCSVAAKQFEQAAQLVRGTWPVPTATSLDKKKSSFPNRGSSAGDDLYDTIATIVKYYYLRGIIHYGCGRDQYAMAHRCWWTCLSIPVDYQNQPLAGAIAIEAWKKLTLVQPLLKTNHPLKGGLAGRNTGAIELASTKIYAMAHPPTRLPKCGRKALTKAVVTLIQGSAANRNTNTEEDPFGAPVSAADENVNMAEAANADDHYPAAAAAAAASQNNYTVYTILGPAVEAGDRAMAEKIVLEHASVLMADDNMDMAQNCLLRAKELQVRKASKIFSVTSLRILARRWKVTPQEASQQLANAAHTGVVGSRVEADGTVVFSSPATVAAGIDHWVGLQEWMILLQKMQHMDVDISTSSKYSCMKQKEGRGGATADVMSGPRVLEEIYGDPSL